MASTPWQTVGPFFSPMLLRPGDDDLTGGTAEGAVSIVGCVTQEGGAPVPGALIEIWQADRDGRYGQPGFRGFGRCMTAADGRYAFRTLKPGAVPGPGNAAQAPHILVSIFAAGLLRRLTTRIYFPDEPLNADDPVLATVDDPTARATLIARDEGDQRFAFDIILRGEGETAFFMD